MTKLCYGQARDAIKMKVKWGNNSKLWFLCGALHNFSTIMHIKFDDAQALDAEVILKTSIKCCKNFNQREITHRQHEVELWFFYTTLCIISTNTNAKFQVNQTGDDKIMLWTRNYSKELSNSSANNSSCSCLITPVIEVTRDLRAIPKYTMEKSLASSDRIDFWGKG